LIDDIELVMLFKLGGGMAGWTAERLLLLYVVCKLRERLSAVSISL
jgi:ABC-type uncharacterized transport system permease subunit